MSKYFIVENKRISTQILAEWDRWEQINRDAKKLCREIGAVKFCYAKSFARLCISAFTFPADATIDTKQWVRVKGIDAWRPRAGTKLEKRIKAMTSDVLLKIMDLIGMEMFQDYHVRSPGVHVVGGKVYLSLPDDVKPKGCLRVSDMEYEKVVGN